MSAWGGEARRVDVIILTVHRVELDAVLQVDDGAVPGSMWESGVGPSGLPVAFRTFVGKAGRPVRVAAALSPDHGATAATQTLVPLVEAWQPRCVAMCGVCAGRRDRTQLGDVVAAERLFYRDTGKQLPGEVHQDLTTYKLRDDWKAALEGMDVVERFRDAAWFRARPLPSEWREHRALLALRDGPAPSWLAVDPALGASDWKALVAALRARGLIARTGTRLTGAGRDRIADVLFEHQGALPDLSAAGAFQPFRLHVAPLGSGAQIDDDAWAFVSHAMRKTVGLDGDGAALGELAHRQRQHRLDAVVMKGVMDFADHGRDAHFAAFAARASAECLLAFLRDHLRTELVAGFDDLLTPGTSSLPTRDLSPSSLLLARHTVVPWHDDGTRLPILAELDAWADDARDVGVKLVHAEGGVGKTRLAIEWVQRRRRRHDVAGFLVPEPGEAWLERLCGLGPPVVVVIDYAERRADLVELLERVAAFAAGDGPRRRVRILLLARNGRDWWTVLRGRSGNLGALLAGVVPERLSPLAVTTRDRDAVYREAWAVFAAVRGRCDGPPPSIALHHGHFERVLYLHMAALAAVEDGRQHAGSLMDVILDHEEHFWVRKAMDRDAVAVHLPLARQIMAAATLRGGFATAAAAREACERLAGRPRSAEDDALLALLHDVYERTDESTYLPGLEPDLLGEAMVLRVAQPSPCGAGDAAWIERVFVADDDEAALTTAFIVLGRAAVATVQAVRPWIMRLLRADLRRHAVLALRAAKRIGQDTAFSALGDLLAEALEQHGNHVIAGLLDREDIPSPTVSLQRVAAWRSRKLLDTIPLGDDPVALSSRAAALAKIGLHLDGSGRPTEAVMALKGAANLYRWLGRGTDRYKAQLAASLNNQGNTSNDLGRREDALVAMKEAVQLYRGLASVDAAVRADLARSLNNLGAIANALGQHDKALAAMTEAVGLYRALGERNPMAYRAELATSLNNLGAALTDRGEHAAAKAATHEAVLLTRTLAAQSRDAFEPDLAWSYHNLGIQLGGLGRHGKALRFALRAVDLYRKLATRNLDVFQADLATSLTSLGNRWSDVGQPDGAVAATREAVDRFRWLAERYPDAFRAPLAMSLNNLGNHLSELRQPDDALAQWREAVELYRRLAIGNHEPGTAGPRIPHTADAACTQVLRRGADKLRRISITWRPDAFRVELSASLIHLSHRLSALGQHREAMAALREVVMIHRLLASWNPEAFRPDLARHMTQLSHRQSQRGLQGAVTTMREVVVHYRVLAEANPDAFQADLARSLIHLGTLLASRGQQDTALGVTLEAVALCRALVLRDGDAYAADLAWSLYNLSNRQCGAGDAEEALAAARAAAECYRALADRNPDAFRPLLARNLNILGLRWSGRQQPREALAPTRAAIELYRALAAADPDEFQPGLAASLSNLASLLSELGARDEAVAAGREVVELRRDIAARDPAAEQLVAASLADLAALLRDLGRHDEALAVVQQADEFRTVTERMTVPRVAVSGAG